MLNVRNSIVKHEEEFIWNSDMSFSCKLKKRTFCVHRIDEIIRVNKGYICMHLIIHKASLFRNSTTSCNICIKRATKHRTLFRPMPTCKHNIIN